MNRQDSTTMTPARKLVGLTLVAAMGAALGCSSGGSSTPGTGGSGTGKGGSTGTAGATGTGGSGTGGSAGGSTGGSTGGTGGSATGTGGSGTGGTGGTGTGGSGGSATGGSGGSGTGGSGGSSAGGSGGSSAGGSGGTGTGGSGGSTTLSLPPTLNVPSGATLKMHLHAVGDQIYTCTASSAAGTGGSGGAGGAGGGGATTYSFVLKQPDAKLYDASNTQVGTHGLGPNWTSTVDGSVVNGAKVYQENSTTAGAIPWLLLRATSHTGTGVFSDVTYVQRVNTSGGAAPATGCDSTTAGMDMRASYMADYYFYTGGGPGTDWMTPPGNLPTAIAVPSGATLKIHDHAIGVQVYTCTASAAGGAGGGGGAGGAGGGGVTTYSWVLKQPDAVLYDSSFAMVGTHGLGPNWTSTDGSVVNGMKVAGVNSTAAGAVQWLLLQASSNTGTGVFSDITYVQRLNTAGGVAAGTCDSTTVGTDTRIPYSADYYFFTGGLSDGGTNG